MTKRQQTIRERIERDFSSMALTTEQTRRCEYIQDLLGAAAVSLLEICPESRELNGAINSLDEAVHWAREAIARHPRRLRIRRPGCETAAQRDLPRRAPGSYEQRAGRGLLVQAGPAGQRDRASALG